MTEIIVYRNPAEAALWQMLSGGAKGNIWRRPPSDLYQNGGSVAGDKPLAFAFVGWHGENDTGYPVEANARLIAAAPDLLEALQWYEAKAVQMGRAAIHQDSKLMLELMKEIAVERGAKARAAIARATGEQP